MKTLTAPPIGLDDDVVFSTSSAKLVPIVFVTDLSSSMGCPATDRNGLLEPKIEGLKRGIAEAMEYVRRETMLRNAARIDLVTFNSQVASTGFKKLDDLRLPVFQASNDTRMKAALQKTLHDCEAFCYEQNATGVNFSQITVMVITDGAGTDGPCDEEMRALLRLQEDRVLYLIGAGIDTCDATRLTAMGFPTVYTLDRMTWRDLIQLATVSAKRLASGQQPCSPMNGSV